jgi:diaminohydroxyphosphoribosylaminopyrimidine deaminase/5-amino-6-(5-phosphoribosylamino)uracil reductase
MTTSLDDMDLKFMRRALQLAKRGYGRVSPNPMVGAVLTRRDSIIGEGWHKKAGEAHAEVAALNDAKQRKNRVNDATLYVTLEPCSTTGRTPPCTRAILDAGIKRVVVACLDPNPKHAGRGIALLESAGLKVTRGVLEDKAMTLNHSFFHWIQHHRPWVTIKAAMTLDGKIATASGESKWITGTEARRHAMKLRFGMDAMLVGIETVLMDDPSLTVRLGTSTQPSKPLLRLVLDSKARIPLDSKLVTDPWNQWTRVVISQSAPRKRVKLLQEKVKVWESPNSGHIDLDWLLLQLGAENVTSLLVEGGGKVNAGFFEQQLVHAVAFYYAPKVLGGEHSRRAVSGRGAKTLQEAIRLKNASWKKVGQDLVMQALVNKSKE